jgi:predicted RNA-binding protein with PUA domain
MKDENCNGCIGKEELTCQGCCEDELLYWCDTCACAVAEKRCPSCGLKARKMKIDDGG